MRKGSKGKALRVYLADLFEDSTERDSRPQFIHNSCAVISMRELSGKGSSFFTADHGVSLFRRFWKSS